MLKAKGYEGFAFTVNMANKWVVGWSDLSCERQRGDHQPTMSIEVRSTRAKKDLKEFNMIVNHDHMNDGDLLRDEIYEAAKVTKAQVSLENLIFNVTIWCHHLVDQSVTFVLISLFHEQISEYVCKKNIQTNIQIYSLNKNNTNI